MMRVLGVDPGTRFCGWGVVTRNRQGLTSPAQGVIRLAPKDPLADRLEVIYDTLWEIIEKHRPQALAVEDIFYKKYPKAAIQLGHVRGVVLLIAAKAGLPLGEYPPALVKRTVAGRGRAPKDQIARLVSARLGLTEAMPEDATDALAIALTYLAAHPVRG